MHIKFGERRSFFSVGHFFPCARCLSSGLSAAEAAVLLGVLSFLSVLSLVRLICANFLECLVSFLCAFWSSFQAFLFQNFCFKMLVQRHVLDTFFHEFLQTDPHVTLRFSNLLVQLSICLIDLFAYLLGPIG